jgi:hypothetical protein
MSDILIAVWAYLVEPIPVPLGLYFLFMAGLWAGMWFFFMVALGKW